MSAHEVWATCQSAGNREHSSEDVVPCPEVGRCLVPLFGDGSWAAITQVAQDETRILCDTGGGDGDSSEVNKPETDVMTAGGGPCSNGVHWALACPVRTLPTPMWTGGTTECLACLADSRCCHEGPRPRGAQNMQARRHFISNVEFLRRYAKTRG